MNRIVLECFVCACERFYRRAKAQTQPLLNLMKTSLGRREIVNERARQEKIESVTRNIASVLKTILMRNITSNVANH